MHLPRNTGRTHHHAQRRNPQARGKNPTDHWPKSLAAELSQLQALAQGAHLRASLDCAFCGGQALELAPFLAALLGNATGAVGSTAGGLLGGPSLGRRLASASSVSVNVYFTVNRIGGAARSGMAVVRHTPDAETGQDGYMSFLLPCVQCASFAIGQRSRLPASPCERPATAL